MDTSQWPQPRKEVIPFQKGSSSSGSGSGSGGKISSRNTQKLEEAIKKCPRCNSTNTKFCYYNNYSLTQPRYFCKTCRRYWTEGGSLRNIPVGGGSRKNKRSSPVSKPLPNLITHDPSSIQNPNHDLNLSFPSSNPSSCGGVGSFSDLIRLDSDKNFRIPSSTTSASSAADVAANNLLPVSALELLTGFSAGARGLNDSNFMPIYSTTGFDPLSLNFSLDGINGSGYGGDIREENNTNGRLLFPFEDLKQVSTNHNNIGNDENEIIAKGDSTGFWSGMLGGNGSW